MYKIGEALVGKGDELAHVDLIIGEREGRVGEVFANGMANPSKGHTPILGVIRPNLPAKPHTLIVPKVTVETLAESEKIFGPAQSAVSKAVADAVEDGIIPEDKAEEWVIIASVFIHPEAEDYRKIYHYNYGATKLAIKRALSEYPSLDKIMYDKDRATHGIMGFRVPRLWRSPYLQIALDIPDLDRVKKVIKETPESDNIIFEVGTPLLKKHGTEVIEEIRKLDKESFLIADLKTLDVGQVEVDLAFDETADAVVASGLAPVETLDKFIYEAHRLGIYAFLDTLNVSEPIKTLKSLRELPDVVILHRGIDVERTAEEEGKEGEHPWGNIRKIKREFKDKKLLVGVAGGIKPDTAEKALDDGADIIIVGRDITQSRDVERSTRRFLNLMKGDIDLHRVHEE